MNEIIDHIQDEKLSEGHHLTRKLVQKALRYTGRRSLEQKSWLWTQQFISLCLPLPLSPPYIHYSLYTLCLLFIFLLLPFFFGSTPLYPLPKPSHLTILHKFMKNSINKDMSIVVGGLGSTWRGYYNNVEEHGEDTIIRSKKVVNKSCLDFSHVEEHGEDTIVMSEKP